MTRPWGALRYTSMGALVALAIAQVAWAEPLPPGDYLGQCTACTLTPVAQAGTLLGCLCGENPAERLPASVFMRTGRCRQGVTWEDGELKCAPAPDPWAVIEAHRTGEATVTIDKVEVLAVPGAVAETAIASRTVPPDVELTVSRLRLAAIDKLPPATPYVTQVDAGYSVPQWNEVSRAPIVLSPPECIVMPGGVMSCMCPREGTLPGPATTTLPGEPTAWRCGCQPGAGLVCIPDE